MTGSQAITGISYALQGTDDDAPLSGSGDYSYWLNTLNRKKDELFRDTKKKWIESYDVLSLGTVTASATPTYDLDDTFLTPSNNFYIITTTGQRVEVELIKPEEKSANVRQAFIAGSNPKKLYFTSDVLAGENIIGGTLYAPGFYMPPDIAGGDSLIICPDPQWLVMATAAEIAFNNIIYEDRAEGLNTKANSLYRVMAMNNRSGTYSNPRVTPTRVYRVRRPERYR